MEDVEPYESPVERAIREAREQGAFDNLPGAGKPLRNLGTDDPDWWVKQYAEREQLDLSGALSPALAHRKEAAAFPGSLADLSTESSVRAVLADYNRRVKLDRLRPGVGAQAPLLAPVVDVEEMVGGWRRLRAEQQAEARARAAARSAVEPERPGSRRGWWPWRPRRSSVEDA